VNSMENIKIYKIDDNSIGAVVSPKTPKYLIDALINSLESKGMMQDLSKNDSDEMVFVRRTIADKLIKALQDLSKQNDIPYDPKEQLKWKREWNKKQEEEKRSKWKSNVNKLPKPQPNIVQTPASNEPDLWPRGPSWQPNTVKKSNYGPKGAGQYTTADNVKRKAKNAGQEISELGANKNVKNWGVKPSAISTKNAVDLEAKKMKKLNRKQPVKQFTPEEIAEFARQRKLASSVDYEQQYEETLSKHENEAMGNLLSLMHKKSMLKNMQPSNDDFVNAGEKMGLGLTKKNLNSAENKWNNTINDWLSEVSKPISSRFTSQADEIEYWNSIKIKNSEEDGSGY